MSDGNAATMPGRTCPLTYRYAPSVFRQPPMLEAETLYVIGGLYGNVEALEAVLAMQWAESRRGRQVTLFFNGDFNWFNVDAESFETVNDTVLVHAAIQGNVEAELAAEVSDAGCGCAYPAWVGDGVVARSNRIMVRLRDQAAHSPAITRRLGALPMHATVAMGGEAIGIIHGDAESLAGWAFTAESLPADPGSGANRDLSRPATSIEQILGYFRAAGVRAFCSSHTCLPVAQDFPDNGRDYLVMNNGAAGMPNFRETAYGVLTRVSAHPEIPEDSLYGITLGGLRFDALPIRYDTAAWWRRFEGNWPTGSAAWQSYHRRIIDGPEYTVAQAARGRVRSGHGQ